MITKETIQPILTELDLALAKEDKTLSFTIFGSSALIIQGFSNPNRATVDIDIIDPKLDMKIQLLAETIGTKHGLDISWLNSAGHIFSWDLPSGWQDRSKKVYKGSNLTVLALHRKDLLLTKFRALCERGDENDRVDLTDLSPSKVELDTAKNWLLKLKSNKLDEKDLDSMVKETIELTKGVSRGREIP